MVQFLIMPFLKLGFAHTSRGIIELHCELEVFIDHQISWNQQKTLLSFFSLTQLLVVKLAALRMDFPYRKQSRENGISLSSKEFFFATPDVFTNLDNFLCFHWVTGYGSCSWMDCVRRSIETINHKEPLCTVRGEGG